MTATHAQVAEAASNYRAAVLALQDANAILVTCSEAYAEAVATQGLAMDGARAARQELLVLVDALDADDVQVDTDLD